VTDVFDSPLIQRCQLHKIRNVRDKLPQRLRPGVERRMRAAYHAESALEAEALLTAHVDEAYHSEGVYAPCFMVRSGRYKLIYVHGAGHQLFDVKDDPGERVDLAGRPELAEVQNALVEQLLGEFDP